jgi:hypothetical protein
VATGSSALDPESSRAGERLIAAATSLEIKHLTALPLKC